MMHIKKHLKLFALLGCVLCATATQAEPSDELLQLEADMLQYIGTTNRDSFYIITEKLKEACQDEGEEGLYYKAWSKEAIFESTHQNYKKANEIAQEIAQDAQKKGSAIGQYYVHHTLGAILQHQDKFAEAEKAYLKALDIRHKNFPKESAAEDLRELMKIAYMQNQVEQAKKYAYQLLAEPNLAPHHKGRTLFRLSTIAFDENDVAEFNRIYEEMRRLTQTNGIKSLNLYTEVNYHIINGDLKQALRMADLLSADSCAERKAIIYHLMGDNDKAYDYMVQYKHLSDSIMRVSHSNVVSNLYLRMNNDRLRLEREVLQHQSTKWHNMFYLGAGIVVILILLFLVYQRHRIIKMLRHDNSMHDYGKEDAEKAIKDLSELSAYESKTSLPLNTPVKVNKLCDHLTNLAQEKLNRSVTIAFQTEFPDTFELMTHADALEKLLSHLMNYAMRFTYQGSIILKCSNSGNFIRFSITDTGLHLGNKPQEHYLNLFTEQGNTERYVGLNFSIWQSITRLLQGRIWYDESYTAGTRFCFELPKEPAQETI